jgi:glycerophosphoryl diester phosphodiesterase
LCLNITKCREYHPDDLQECPPGGLPLPFAHISLRNVYADEEFVAACHRHGVAALAWDFIDEGDPVARIRELVAQGFDGILFDDPTTVDPIRNWQRPFDAERGRP